MFETVRSFDGTRLAHAVWGGDAPAGDPAPTVILANGIACTDTYWTYLVPFLVEHGHRVVFFDYRGHGRSGPPKNPNEIALPSHARDLWRVADATGSGPVVLIGHSMGAQTILEAYRQQPGRVAGLVPVAGPYEHPLNTFYGSPAMHYLFPFMQFGMEPVPWLTRALWRAAGASTTWPYVVGRASRMIGPRADRGLMDEYFRHLARLDPILFVRMAREMQAHSARDLLADVDVPVLVVAGRHDVMTPPRVAREMVAVVPDATLEFFEDSGHTLPIDEPHRLNDVVLAFLHERAGFVPVAGTASAAGAEPV